MKKFLVLVFISTIYFVSQTNAADMEWEGTCFIKYDEKVVVNDELCSIRQDGFSLDPTSYKHIDEADNFQIVAVKDVPCNDGSSDCAYYFSAQKHLLEGEVLYQINYNIETIIKSISKREIVQLANKHFDGIYFSDIQLISE